MAYSGESPPRGGRAAPTGWVTEGRPSLRQRPRLGDMMPLRII
jgi:hypothetical protein